MKHATLHTFRSIAQTQPGFMPLCALGSWSNVTTNRSDRGYEIKKSGFQIGAGSGD